MKAKEPNELAENPGPGFVKMKGSAAEYLPRCYPPPPPPGRPRRLRWPIGWTKEGGTLWAEVGPPEPGRT